MYIKLGERRMHCGWRGLAAGCYEIGGVAGLGKVLGEGVMYAQEIVKILDYCKFN